MPKPLPYYNPDGSIKQVVYVDANMKICEKKPNVRVARYNEQYDLYVVDTPTYDKKSIDWKKEKEKD